MAWCLKNENVHCILLGASTSEQLLENIHSIQVISKEYIFIYLSAIFNLQIVHKLTPSIVNDIERILNNRPVSRQQSKTDTQKNNSNTSAN